MDTTQKRPITSVLAGFVLLGAVALTGAAGATEPGDVESDASVATPSATVVEATAATFSLDWWSVDGGGGTATGGSFTLTGTVGQPDAATMSGHGTVADGGLWSSVRVLSFADGFELGDTRRWSDTSP